MSRLVERMRRGQPARMDRNYVSDFTRFIDHFLDDHPEEIKTQHTGWRLYWDKLVDLRELEKAERDSVHDDGYGFYASAWGRRKRH